MNQIILAYLDHNMKGNLEHYNVNAMYFRARTRFLGGFILLYLSQ